MDQREIIFIDANIFLEFMLGDKNAAICENLLKRIKNKDFIAKTSDFIIYACLLQIRRKLNSNRTMHDFILLINELSNLEIIRPSLNEMYGAITISEKYKLDFDDSLVVSCMVNNEIKSLISLDKDFDKIHLIKRKEPFAI